MPLVSDRQAIHESPEIKIDNQLYKRVETQTTNQRQMQSRSMARSQCWATESKRTGSLSAPDVNSTGNNQPRKKAYCGIPTRVHPHLPGLTLNQYTTWLAAQKARTSSRGHHRGLCVIQCGGWLTPIFSTLFAIRADKRHRYCMMEWACRWCRIVKRYTSLHRLILIINFTSGWRLKRQTNGNAITVYGQKPMLDNSIEKDRIA